MQDSTHNWTKLGEQVNPAEESSFVDQHAATAATDDFIKAIFLGEKDEVAQPTHRWPLMMLIPFGDGDQLILGLCRCVGFHDIYSVLLRIIRQHRQIRRFGNMLI